MNQRIENVVQILDEKKAENIQVFDMRDKDYFVDDVVIATTLGAKHGLSLLDYLKDKLKANKESFLNIEQSDEWVVMDLGDVLIHLMSHEYRTRYNMEEFLAYREDNDTKSNTIEK